MDGVCLLEDQIKNHHEDTCLKEIGQHPQFLLTTPQSTMNKLGGHLYSIEESTNAHLRERGRERESCQIGVNKDTSP